MLRQQYQRMPIQKPTRHDAKMPKGLELAELNVGDGPKARRAFAGFERGIEGMQVGGLRQLRVPPHLGYQDGRLLVCKIELLSIGHYR